MFSCQEYHIQFISLEEQIDNAPSSSLISSISNRLFNPFRDLQRLINQHPSFSIQPENCRKSSVAECIFDYLALHFECWFNKNSLPPQSSQKIFFGQDRYGTNSFVFQTKQMFTCKKKLRKTKEFFPYPSFPQKTFRSEFPRPLDNRITCSIIP